MNKSGYAMVIDHHQLKGTKVQEILSNLYTMVLRPQQTFFKHAINSLGESLDSVDLIVVGNGGYLEQVLEKHRTYKIPTILRVDTGSQFSADIATRANRGYYQYYMMSGIEQDIQKWQEYIEEAKKRVQLL